jgi:molybdopterin/thiamine biosynthesis adenylyltransferase
MRIVFCGVGAVGSSAATLCRSLGADLAFVDFDRVESKNLAAQAFVKASLGKNKAEALKLQLATFHGIKSQAFPVRLVAANVATLCGSADLVVDCFDNATSRGILQSWAQGRSQPLVHAALSGDGSFGLVRWTDLGGHLKTGHSGTGQNRPPRARRTETGGCEYSGGRAVAVGRVSRRGLW